MSRRIIHISVGIVIFLLSVNLNAKSKKSLQPAILKSEDYKCYIDYFNRMEDENIVQAIPNSESWNWLKTNIPLFDCPQDNFEEMFYYRWWTLRKHIKETPQGYVFTEFLVKRSYADKYNMIACAIGHHIYEARWLHDQQYLDQYLHLWYRGNDGDPMKKLYKFSSWTSDALYNRYLVNKDVKYLLDMFPDMEKDYQVWLADRYHKKSGLFWQHDVKDGMEEMISGGRKVENERPTINSYMFGNSMALANMAKMANDTAKEKYYLAMADSIKERVLQKLWNPEISFFETVKPSGEYAHVREAIGYLPWYFNLPTDNYEEAWRQLVDEQGFNASFGITTAERRHPEFRTHGCCKCEWDGAIWPFTTSQTLVALANLLNNYDQSVMNDSVYFRNMEVYVESQYYRGRPYIGEYLDETTGYWLKGDQERSRYYNHSTFNDLIITGLVGLRPRADEVIEINPLIPDGKWDYFCLDNVLYHGKIVSIVWDKDGSIYKKGKGLSLFINGKKVAHSDNLERIIYQD
ncbi:MAG: hypothetical protein JW717_02620 [Marinilabiliaceae bacterium]|nr:hypothetical protein [Marinilabiliaceae bacterium]